MIFKKLNVGSKVLAGGGRVFKRLSTNGYLRIAAAVVAKVFVKPVAALGGVLHIDRATQAETKAELQARPARPPVAAKEIQAETNAQPTASPSCAQTSGRFSRFSTKAKPVAYLLANVKFLATVGTNCLAAPVNATARIVQPIKRIAGVLHIADAITGNGTRTAANIKAHAEHLAPAQTAPSEVQGAKCTATADLVASAVKSTANDADVNAAALFTNHVKAVTWTTPTVENGILTLTQAYAATQTNDVLVVE